MALRMFADALMVLLSLLAATTLSFIGNLLINALPEQFWTMLAPSLGAAWQLVIICLLVFYLSGFYTYGRFYQGRYKALVVFQAVCQSYLSFGFALYFLYGKIT